MSVGGSRDEGLWMSYERQTHWREGDLFLSTSSLSVSQGQASTYYGPVAGLWLGSEQPLISLLSPLLLKVAKMLIELI